jgi:hypothetical protein
VDDQPLVVPPRNALRLDEEFVAFESWKSLANDLDDLVMELEEKEMKLRHDDVLIVPRIADEGPPSRELSIGQ